MKNVFAFYLTLISVVQGQNLVPNGGFENAFTCNQYMQNGGPPLLLCVPWYQAFSTPDFFSDSFPLLSCGAAGFPNTGGGWKYPNNGKGMTGFAFFDRNFSNYREYLGAPLLTPLINNHQYFVSFYVSPGGNCSYSTDDIGVFFSIDSLSEDTFLYFSLIPQFENTQGNIISDTGSWTQVSGYFTASGGEKYFYVGNFKNDANTTLDSITGAFSLGGYYFLDDVSVIDCTAVSIYENEIERLIELYPNPFQSKFSIQLPATIKFEQAEIFYVTGEKIFETRHQKEIDVGVLPKGVYFVRIKTKKGVAYKKLIKK